MSPATVRSFYLEAERGALLGALVLALVLFLVVTLDRFAAPPVVPRSDVVTATTEVTTPASP